MAEAKRLAKDWIARLARGALGGVAAGLAGAVLDSAWARDASHDVGMRAGPIAAFFADGGLIAPFALAIAIGVVCATIALDPARATSPTTLIAALRVRAIGRPAEVAAFVPLVVLGAFFWMTVSAQLARAVLGLEIDPPLTGITVAAASLAVGLVIALAVLVLVPPLRHALATASETRPAAVDPAVTGAFALVTAIALFAYGIVTGGVSGEHGLFGIYGVLKRPELDLRAPAILVAIALAALLAPRALHRVPRSIAALLAFAPLALTVRDAHALNEDPALALAIQRGAPLGHPALSILQKLTDRDHDGYSGSFGGGDCDDTNPNINPAATDIPGNGIDEDCSGSDLDPNAVAPPPSATRAGAPSARAKVAADLNLVLITVDTLRDDVGFMGYGKPTTPNLDALATKSTIFDHAYSLASYTGKSVGPLLIGKYPSETHRNWGHFNKFDEHDTFVAERLQRAGIHTMSVQGHRYFGKWGGLERGFDVLDVSAAPPEGTAWDVDTLSTSDKISDAVLKLLESPEHTSKRFFLWVHYLDPHADYLRHDDVPKFGTSQRDMYDGEVAFTDKHIGRVLDAIAHAPWGEHTAVVFTSDHGEAFGEHKMWRHGFEVWEPLVHVPLFVHVPGAPPSHVSVRRSAIDVVPTILEILRAPEPSGTADDFVSGVSLLPDVFLEAGAKSVERDVLVDMPAGPYNDARRAFYHDNLKLIVSNETQRELYDITSDPDEAHDLARTPAMQQIAPLYQAMKARLHEIKVTGDRR